MKHIAPQIEIAWDKPEPFSLKIEQTLDGERLAKEQALLEQAEAEAEKQQTVILLTQ